MSKWTHEQAAAEWKRHALHYCNRAFALQRALERLSEAYIRDCGELRERIAKLEGKD